MSLWDDVRSNLAEWYSVTSVKTTELAKISTRRYDKFGISREIERQFSELGSLVYAGLKEEKEGLLEDSLTLELVARIQELEAELRNKDQEIDDIKNEYSHRQDSDEGPGGEDYQNSTTSEPMDEQSGAAAKLITDPVLEEGSSQSAILVEPAADEDGPRDSVNP